MAVRLAVGPVGDVVCDVVDLAVNVAVGFAFGLAVGVAAVLELLLVSQPVLLLDWRVA